MSYSKSHFINGQWLRGSGKHFQSIDPSTESIVWEGEEATEHEINFALTSAKKAFEKWGTEDLATRIYHLHAFKESLSRSKDILAEAISKETGKPLWESKAEVMTMINKIPISIDAYSVRCPEMLRKQDQNNSVTRHRPHGVMAVFGPFNFPGHLPNGHIIPALLAGNTVIFKPSELTPYVAEITIECWKASGIPDGVINLVQGGSNTGKILSRHPELDGLLFTGSWNTGRLLAESFAQAPYKILALEMGGNNPLIIGDVSNKNLAAHLTILSSFLTSGQRCTCSRRLIILDGKNGNSFLDTLLRMTKQLLVGAFNDNPEPFMGPVINSQTALKLLSKQNQLISSGAKPLLRLENLKRGKAFLSPGILDVSDMTEREDEEIFGPLLQIIRVSSFEEALFEANNTKYGLVAGLLSDSEDEYIQFYNRIKAGVINWNTPLTGASSAAPFGGQRQSGNNRPGAFYAADYCAYPVASLESKILETPTKIFPGINYEV